MSDSHSISATRDNERTSTAPKVALMWLAATMTASSLPVGVLITQMFSLASFLWVVLLASLLFIAVGVLSIPGFVYGIQTMAISARVFGKPFNKFISFSNWLSQIGWQVVVLVLVVYILRSVLNTYSLVSPEQSLYVALLIAVCADFVVPIIGYGAIISAQTVVALFLALFAIAILILLHGAEALTAVPASGHFNVLQALGGVSLVLMGGAFCWTMFASDCSLYGCIIDNSGRNLHASHSILILELITDSSGFVNYFRRTMDRYYDSLYFTETSNHRWMISIAVRLVEALIGVGLLISKYGVLAKRFKHFIGRYAH